MYMTISAKVNGICFGFWVLAVPALQRELAELGFLDFLIFSIVDFRFFCPLSIYFIHVHCT